MTAEELMNSEKYEPDNGICFQEYHGDWCSSVPSMMVDFARFHVQKALDAACDKATFGVYQNDDGQEPFHHESNIFVDRVSIIKSYSLDDIR